MNETIEKLKNNEKAFGLLTEGEKELLAELRGIGHLQYYSNDGWIVPLATGCCSLSGTYRIKPDYQPEPEIKFVEYDIFEDKEGELRYCCADEAYTEWIHNTPRYKNFAGFVYENGSVSNHCLAFKVPHSEELYNGVDPEVYEWETVRPIKVRFKKN